MTAAIAAASTLLAAAPIALGGQDVLWSVPYPSASVYTTSESTVYGGSFPNDSEIADDFEATGMIESLFVPGRGCGQCGIPEVDGVWVRIYEWTSTGPGALQHEAYVPAGPAFDWGGGYPYFLNIDLPEPVAVNGWHFISVQVDFGATGGYWVFAQNNRFNEINMPIQFRDNLDGGVWEQDHFFSTPQDADAAITIYGTSAPSTPVIGSVSRTTFTGSDRITVTGSGFGAPGTGQLLVDGLPALVTAWSSTSITAYTPEGVAPGPADLVVENLGAPSAPFGVTVTERAPNGRVRWVFEGDGDYTSFPPGIGPDGTLYFHDIDGKLYSLSADGGLNWIVDALLGQQGTGDEGPVEVGADGTIYVGTNPLGPTVEVVAFDPDGSHRWTFTVPNGLTWQAGPTLGPDGRLYAAINAATTLGNPYDVLALNPDGSVAWTAAADPFVFEDAAHGARMVFGPSSPGGPIDQMMFTADRNGDGRNYGFALDDGDQRFATPIFAGNDVGQGQLASNPVTGDFYMMEFSGLGGIGWALQSFTPDGDRDWLIDPGIASGATRPAVGPAGNVYFGWDLARMTAVDANGDELWTNLQSGAIYNDPMPSPTAPLLLCPGNLGFSAPGFVEARDTATGDLLWEQAITDDIGADVAVDSAPRFSADGNTAYFSALELPITPTSTYRIFAIDTSGDVDPGVDGDVDGDGTVDVSDLVAVILAWGPCGSCPADLDSNGMVDVSDLVRVVLNWS